jgi:hypothetical protein
MGFAVEVGSGVADAVGTAGAAAVVGDVWISVGVMITVTATATVCLVGVGLAGTGDGVGDTDVAHPTTPSNTNSKKIALVRMGKSYW